MRILGKKEPLLLLSGDIFFFIVSLWLALFLRSFSLPSANLFLTHFLPFTLLFVVWVAVFYIAGLYGKHTLILKTKLPSVLLNTVLVNAVIAVLFFYFIDFFGITPKTILFIYLAVSFVVILFWRMQLYLKLGSRRATERAYLIGSGAEAKELRDEIDRNDIYNIRFVDKLEESTIVIINFADAGAKSLFPDLYRRIFSGVNYVNMHNLYENIFDRVPLSLLNYDWFLQNISTAPKSGYDTMKRIMDVVISLPLLAVSAIFFPFVALAIKLDSPGPVFINQERFGQNNRLIKLVKFRSMERNEHDKWVGEGDNRVTRVGKFVRNTRIDELPQLWNVLKGDISLIGPRPDITGLGKKLQEEIPYYNVRNVVRPGLSGWAQINQQYEKGNISPQSIEETKIRLSYDLYYIKNRSFLLDLQIALRTIKTLASRVGR
jgi:lipopolysaccharide/colanic/teichoic acid biosynthesis glycosyltransferase